MKKAVMVLVVLFLMSGVSFAAETKAEAKKSAPHAAVKSHEAKGVIDSVTLGAADKKTKSELTLKEDSGDVVHFEFSHAAVRGVDGKFVSADKLKAGEKVMVHFVSKQGHQEAKSIQLI